MNLLSKKENKELSRYILGLPDSTGKDLLIKHVISKAVSDKNAARVISKLSAAFTSARLIMLRALKTNDVRADDAKRWIKENTNGSTNI